MSRFKNDKLFRLQVLSNVVRGGTYEIFVNLMRVLVTNDEKKEEEDAKKNEEEDDMLMVIEDYEGFASLVNGHGADGHTLAHWCAKRGMFHLNMLCLDAKVILIQSS